MPPATSGDHGPPRFDVSKKFGTSNYILAPELEWARAWGKGLLRLEV